MNAREKCVMLALCMTACSSSSSAPSADGGATSSTVTCGSGSLTGTVRITDVSSLGPIASATVSAPGCTTGTTDDRGYINVAADPGLLKVTIVANGYVKAYTEGTLLKGGFAETGADYPDSAKAALVPMLSDSNGYVFVTVGGDGSDGGACADGRGSAVSVNGHPEIKPAYLSALTTVDPAGTATEGFGAVLGPLPPGTYQIDGTKTGCKTVGRNDGYFSWGTSTTVAGGTVSIVPLSLTPQ